MMRTLTLVCLAVACVLAQPRPGAAADPASLSATTTLTIVNVEYEGTKVWVPGSIVVKQGSTVTLKLINNVPPEGSQHGFTIPAVGVAAVVTHGTPATVEFTANEAGIFPMFCQLHPAHVGGQLVVLP